MVHHYLNKEEFMPIQKVMKNGKVVGYKWGEKGKVYKKKEDAEKQGRAIKASQNKKK